MNALVLLETRSTDRFDSKAITVTNCCQETGEFNRLAIIPFFDQ